MTIDERLDRLTARHAALTQSVELLLAETRELRDVAAELHGAVGLDAENIRGRVRIAELREQRISDLEDVESTKQ